MLTKEGEPAVDDEAVVNELAGLRVVVLVLALIDDVLGVVTDGTACCCDGAATAKLSMAKLYISAMALNLRILSLMSCPIILLACSLACC